MPKLWWSWKAHIFPNQRLVPPYQEHELGHGGNTYTRKTINGYRSGLRVFPVSVRQHTDASDPCCYAVIRALFPGCISINSLIQQILLSPYSVPALWSGKMQSPSHLCENRSSEKWADLSRSPRWQSSARHRDAGWNNRRGPALVEFTFLPLLHLRALYDYSLIFHFYQWL